MLLVTVKFMLCAKIKLVANLQIIDKDIYWTGVRSNFKICSTQAFQSSGVH